MYVHSSLIAIISRVIFIHKAISHNRCANNRPLPFPGATMHHPATMIKAVTVQHLPG